MLRISHHCSATVVLSCIAIFGCDRTPSVAADTVPPRISDVSIAQNPNPTVPLAAILTLSTDEPARITLLLDDGQRSWSVTPSEQFVTEHSVMVLGMRPGRSHSIVAAAVDTDGNTSESESLIFETGPLPEEIFQPTVAVLKSDQMEPGVTLFNFNQRWGSDGRQLQNFGALIIVDERGDIVWFYRADHRINEFIRLRNGNIFYGSGQSGRLREIDMLGNVVQQWQATRLLDEIPADVTPVDTDSFHHEELELPNGNFLALSSEARLVEDFRTSETDPDAPRAPSTVIGDVVVEFSRDGTVQGRWHLLDLIDIDRIGYESLDGGFWERLYGDVAEAPIRDWAHANGIAYDPRDDSIIISSPVQDVLIKVDRESSELVWLLGTPTHWVEPWSSRLLKPVGELEWPYFQHGASFTGDGTLVMLDNGNYRASAFEPKMPVEDSYSRAVEYAIDEETMEVSEVWHYGGPGDEPFYSGFLGDVDWLPVTGNLLVTDGTRVTDADGRPVAPGPPPGGPPGGMRAGPPGEPPGGMQGGPPGGVRRWARIVEVTHTQPAEKVFELVFADEPPAGVAIYRAKHLASLYP